MSSVHSNDFSTENMNHLMEFIVSYMVNFCKTTTEMSSLTNFDYEFIRMINYMIRFGLFIYRNNQFQTRDVTMVFKFL